MDELKEAAENLVEYLENNHACDTFEENSIGYNIRQSRKLKILIRKLKTAIPNPKNSQERRTA